MTRRFLRQITALALMSWVCASTFAEASTEEGAEDYVFATEAPVVAIGDVHGAFQEFFRLLQGIGVINAEGQWVGGATHLVSLGDLVDRGPDSKSAMDLLMRLQKEAPLSGGRVHVLLGNHEHMNLGGDLRDVSQAEFAALGGEEGHLQAFSRDGVYGAWLRSNPVAIRINDSLFAHAGFSSLARMPLAKLNQRFWQVTEQVIGQGRALQAQGLLSHDWSLLDPSADMEDAPKAFKSWQDAARSSTIGERSLIWYRGNVACHPYIEADNIDAILLAHGAKRIVVGHTPTRSREVELRHGGKVVSIDTGMLNAVYRGKPRALRIVGDALTVLLPDGEERAPIDVGTIEGAPEEFIELNERSAKKEAAAYLLSKYLNLGFVLPTEVTDDGVLRGQDRLITERVRLERQLYRANYCEYESDFDLVAAFDALIGKKDRNMDNLAYRRANWDIVLLDNGNAFDTSSRLPAYAQPPKLNARLRARLINLDQETLQQALGQLLRSREIGAILKRRDKILSWPEA